VKKAVSWVLTGIAVALLLFLGYTGIAGGMDQFDKSTHDQYTIGQIVQTVFQLIFGVLSFAVIGTWFWKRSSSRPVIIAWIVSLTVAGGLASVAWGQTSIWIGIISGAASALVAWAIAALLRAGARGTA
jgi:amino acid transporter